MVHETLQDLFHKDEIDEKTFEYLNPRNHKIRTPVIYVLPKIHKAPPANSKFAGRPIIRVFLACLMPSYKHAQRHN